MVADYRVGDSASECGATAARSAPAPVAARGEGGRWLRIRMRSHGGVATCQREYPHRPSARTHRGEASRAGFTLVEVVLATVISVMVFAAMGVLLTRCFSLWLEATARWQMAQTARITRERILSGGYGDPRDGLLAAENTSDYGSGMESGWNYLFYRTVEKPAVWQILRGWQGTGQGTHIQLSRGFGGWVYAQSSLSDEPLVMVDRFVFTEGDPIEMRYRLRMRVAGREIEQEHAIRAKLVNRK